MPQHTTGSLLSAFSTMSSCTVSVGCCCQSNAVECYIAYMRVHRRVFDGTEAARLQPAQAAVVAEVDDQRHLVILAPGIRDGALKAVVGYEEKLQIWHVGEVDAGNVAL